MLISEMTNTEASVAVTAVILASVEKGAKAIGEKKLTAKVLLDEVIVAGLSDRSLNRVGNLVQGSKTKEGVNAYRIIDRCLQKLRKAGTIKSVGGEWVKA